MSNKRSSKWIAVIATIIAFIIVIALFMFYSSPQEDYITVDEYGNYWSRLNMPAGKRFDIRDKVVKAETLIMPQILNNLSGVDPENSSTYTDVLFESNNGFPIPFFGDRLNEFIPGKTVTFNITVKEYELSGYRYNMTESFYVNQFMVLYGGIILMQNFSSLEFQKNNVSQDYTFTVQNITEFYPNPMYWSDIIMEIEKVTGSSKPPLPTINLHDSNDQFIGELGYSRNLQLDIPIQVGDYLSFNYNSTEYGVSKLIFKCHVDLHNGPFPVAAARIPLG